MLASRMRIAGALCSRPHPARSAAPALVVAHVRWFARAVDIPVPKSAKVWASADEAVKDVKSGDTILSGGPSFFRDDHCGFLIRWADVVDVIRVRIVRHPWSVIGHRHGEACWLTAICAFAESLISALVKRSDVKDLTAVSNNAGLGDHGLAKLLRNGQLDKLIISYLGG